MSENTSTDVPEDVIEDATIQAQVRAETHAGGDPARDRFVWSVLWKVVAVGLIVTIGCFLTYQTRHLLGMLVIATFFALAMIPGINALQRRWDIRRGTAVAIIYLIAVIVVGLMVGILIPSIVKFAGAVSENIGAWLAEFNTWSSDTFGSTVIEDPDASSEAVSHAMYAIAEWGGNILGAITTGIGVVFDIFTIAAFAFYIAADFPRIVRAFMGRMPPERQRLFGWIAEQSIEQTGGYFYSRMLLMMVNSGLGFLVMMILGLPLVYALFLAVFMGFVSAFIPFIGTYIGAAIPIIVLLAVEGVGPAIIMTVYIIVYQQAENYWLSPRFSSQTMELNGAIAFGGALAGGAIAGPMGAFMALPVAALITAIIKNTGKTYEVVDVDHHQAPHPQSVSAEADDAHGVDD
jgi:predicted PurR-regulated permease PerM